MPNDNTLVLMILTTMVALNQANATGNYSVLRELAAPGFQEANDAARLAEIFSSLRKRNLDLSPVLLFQPKLVRKPSINARDMLQITGFFPTKPEQVNFDLLFQVVQGRWRLFGIAVDTSPAQQAATPSPPNAGQRTAPPVPKTTSEAPPKAPEGQQPSRLAKPEGDASPAGVG